MTPAGFGRRYIAFLLDVFFLEFLGMFATVPLVNQTDLDLVKILIRWFTVGSISREGVLLLILYCLVLSLLWAMLFRWVHRCLRTNSGQKNPRFARCKRDWGTGGLGCCFDSVFSRLSRFASTLGPGILLGSDR